MAPLISLCFPLPEPRTRALGAAGPLPVIIGMQEPQGLPALPATHASRESEAIVRQVDHVLVAIPDDGRNLVSLLTERLALPIVWPQPGSEWKASTGISLGNVNLEIFHREPPPPGQPPRIPRITSLALQPTNLKIALNELRLRGITHDPPPEPKSGPAREPLPRWTTVGLRGFGHGLFLIQYAFDMDERRLRFDRVLREGQGGPLGVVRVREVVIAPDPLGDVRAQWTKLLGPAETGEADLWVVGEGPRIRLVSGGDPRTGNIVVEVQSLKRAARALRRLGISAEATRRQIRIDPEVMSGLRLMLVEQQRPLRPR
ncbi:MAG TPA: hypothetical protein VEW46_25005 [Pyrinomonadaceae bacterium]|nr:hypothetical protein [Pyrinomonadaceae bacterium]